MGYRAPLADPGTPVNCPERPFDLITAVVYFDETVVVVTAPEVVTSDGTLQSPYNTLDGMRAVVAALQARSPTD
jgi:hypothetical protein